MSITATLTGPRVGFDRSLLPLLDALAPRMPWVRDHEIRPIRSEDLAAIADTLPAAPYRSHEDDLNWQRTGAVTEVVAWDDSSPVGSGFIHWTGPRDPSIAKLVPDCPEIFRLEVLETHRSKGIGAALVRELESIAQARGLTRVGLGVGIANHRARRLYERLGYRLAEAPQYVDRCRRPGSDGQPIVSEEPCVYMTKDLVPLMSMALGPDTLAA